ncbi:MAG: multiheme c-type cytochrome [Anaerolineales bacterium]|nr:multiheme c-type cytochrome [Anaerolineales bacterium]
MAPNRSAMVRRAEGFPFDLWLLLAAGVLFVALGLAWWMNRKPPEPVSLTPSLTGQPEYCLTCHAALPEISPSHPVQAFGCVTCHGGERLALDADLAHSSMRGGANPSDLTVAEQSCGGSNCHSGDPAQERDHIQRVRSSIQSTYTGAITSVRYTFGAQSDQNPRFGAVSISDPETQTGIVALQAYDPASETSPLLRQFGENCLTCHINTAPREGQAYARYTGCASCHTPDAPSQSKTEVHRLTTSIPYTQCNTCHNRGNYDLRQMAFVERADHPARRIEDYYQPIAEFVQCEYTLDCIDCHTRAEAMGDGDIHANQASAEYVQCKTCHGTLTELPLTKTLSDPDDLAFKLALLNPLLDLQLGDTILVTTPSPESGQRQGEPLWNIRQLADGTFEMVGKATRQYFTFRPVQGTACQQNPAEQESQYCHKCHAVER